MPIACVSGCFRPSNYTCIALLARAVVFVRTVYTLAWLRRDGWDTLDIKTSPTLTQTPTAWEISRKMQI